MKIEQGPMKQNEEETRLNISISRSIFIHDIIHANENNYLNSSYLSEQLETYEKIVQTAVEGNIMMNNTNGNLSDPTAFPVQTEKWTLIQAIFFASTICTTIG